MNDQAYYCVIPSSLIADPSISMAAKLAYGIITSLAKREGYAWVSNATLGGMVGEKGERAAQRWVSELAGAGWIGIELDCDGGRTSRKLRIAEVPTRKGGETKMSPGVDKNVRGGETKMSPNNTSDNTRDKDKTIPTEWEPPLGDSLAAPLPFPLETIRQEVAERGMAECAPMPGEWLEAAPRIITGPPDPKKALEAEVMARFEERQPDGRFPSPAYPKEWKGVKRLVTEAIGRQPDNPKAWIGGYLAAWARLKRDRRTLIFGQPDTPSKMASGYMDYVIAEMARAGAVTAEEEEIIPF